MSRSGLWAQVGMVAETTVGTYATPTRFLEFRSATLQATIDRIESTSLRVGARTARSNRWVAGRRQVGGELNFEVMDRGFGLPLAYAFGGGTVVTSTPASGTLTRDHLITQTLNYGRALTIQVGKPDVGGTVQPFSYLGCKVTEASLSSSVDGFLELSMTLSGHDEATGVTLATASFPATQLPLHWIGGTFSLGGSALDVKDFSFNVNHGLFTERFFQRSSGGTIQKEPIEADFAEVTGSITVEFDGLTNYNRYINGTEATLAGTWQGSTIEGTLTYQVSVGMDNVRFDGETPTVEGPGILEQTIPFKALSSGTLTPYSVRYRTTDTVF